MKNILLIAFVALLTSSLYAQNVTPEINTDGAVITFETQTIDYGSIEKGSDGTREFKFTNTGNAPLKITKVKSTCGCTIPTYPEQEIMPGESDVIKVVYNTKTATRFSKSVSIYTNGTPSRAVLRIKGKVVDPNAPAPLQKKKSMLSTN